MRYEVKSVIFGRRPRKNPEEFKTSFFMLYDIENPIGSDAFPKYDLEFSNTEYVQIPKLDGLKYYLEGNDMVIAGINAITITQKDTIVTFEIEK